MERECLTVILDARRVEIECLRVECGAPGVALGSLRVELGCLGLGREGLGPGDAINSVEHRSFGVARRHRDPAVSATSHC